MHSTLKQYAESATDGRNNVNTGFIILLSTTVLLSIISVFLIIRQYRLKKDINILCDGINKFINTKEKIQFSVHDDLFSELQNSIADLQDIITLEQNKRLSDNKKNTEFISDISHQLKTPISALRLYCEMDINSNPTEHSEKGLQLIDKIEKLIYQLLRLEKIETDAYVMDFRYNKAEIIIKKLIADFKPLFPKKDIRVTGSSTVRCDSIWLEEAIGNVIKNACEHTAPDGKINIEISENNRSTLIAIADNGGGAKDDELTKLFTRFYKAEGSSSNSAGIGLAITKAIIEKHHGIISAENKNNGLCVTICIPHIDGYENI